ncbi:MAG TPA: hypothetical protein VJQ44_14845 [Gemmatimonadales bacterium]|nr:hypothetical protein [Gemmatimonadales bacterium]
MSPSRKADQTEPQPDNPPPDSAMGGAADAGAHGRHPASAPAMAREHRPPAPEDVPGDAAIERRHHIDPAYRGAERRLARR